MCDIILLILKHRCVNNLISIDVILSLAQNFKLPIIMVKVDIQIIQENISLCRSNVLLIALAAGGQIKCL